MTERSRDTPNRPMQLVPSTDQSRARDQGDPQPPTITLLGGFRIGGDTCDVALPVGAQRLVALLALRGTIGRSRLAGMLWPDTTETRALASLRTGIWRVNQASAGLVVSAAGQVHLTHRATVDVHDLVARSVDLLHGGDPERIPLDGPLTSAFDEGLLPHWDDDWLICERERLHQLRLHLLEALADGLAASGRYGLAIEMALRALSADPLRESAHRTLLRVHLAEGNFHEAERALTACKQVLGRELGIAPNPALSDLVHRAQVERWDRTAQDV